MSTSILRFSSIAVLTACMVMGYASEVYAYTFYSATTQSRAASAAPSSTFSFTHNHSASANALIVGVVVPTCSLTNVTATYGGQAMMLLRNRTQDGLGVWMLALQNPPSGSNTVLITYSSPVAATAVTALSYNWGAPQSITTTQSDGSSSPTQCRTNSHTQAGSPLFIEIFGAKGANRTPFTQTGVPVTERFERSSGSSADDVAIGGGEVSATGSLTSCMANANGPVALIRKVITFPASPSTPNINCPLPAPPTVDLRVDGSNGPVTVAHLSNISLSWTTTNSPTACTASGSWSGAKNTAGSSENAGPLSGAATYTYTIDCSNAGGSATDTVTVNVSAPPATDFDCGLRIRENSATVRIACEPVGTLTSPLRIRKNSTTHGVLLVPTTDALASKTRIQTSAGIRALKRLP